MKIIIATSKTLAAWGADVGLGKHLYAVLVASEAEIAPGLAGQSDWKVLAVQDCAQSEQEVLARLARREKQIDPNYYPKLKGANCVFKVDPAHIQNAMLVAAALEGKEPPKGLKVKPADVAAYLIRNALG